MTATQKPPKTSIDYPMPPCRPPADHDPYGADWSPGPTPPNYRARALKAFAAARYRRAIYVRSSPELDARFEELRKAIREPGRIEAVEPRPAGASQRLALFVVAVAAFAGGWLVRGAVP